jgi:hypothetical protein
MFCPVKCCLKSECIFYSKSIAEDKQNDENVSREIS